MDSILRQSLMVDVDADSPAVKVRKESSFNGASNPNERGSENLQSRNPGEEETVPVGAGSGTSRLKICALATVAVAGLWLAGLAWAGQVENASTPSLPDSPQKKTSAGHEAANPGPCQVKRTSVVSAWGAAASAAETTGDPAAAATAAGIGSSLAQTLGQAGPEQAPCPTILKPFINWYARFLDGPQVKPMTPKEKAWLAVRDVADPFNAITILGSSAIAVGSNAYSPYGPAR